MKITEQLAARLTGPAGAEPTNSFVGLRSLLGAAKVDEIGTKDRDRRTNQSVRSLWQKKLWEHEAEIGELSYAMGFIGNCYSRVTLTIGLVDRLGNVGPVFDEDGNVLRDENGNPRPELARAEEAHLLLQALRGPGGGQSEIMRRCGENLAGPGEVWLLGSKKAGDQRNASEIPVDELWWEALSSEELIPTHQGFRRNRGNGLTFEEIKAEDVAAIRVWKSHPRFSDEATSSMRSQMETLEELSLLSRQIRARALSHVATAGLLLVPNEIQWQAQPDAPPGEDPFALDLVETMRVAVDDKGSPATFVPLVVRAPGEHLHPDKFRKLDLTSAVADEASEEREKTVIKFARGTDLPVEVVTGHAGTKFANAVVIDDATFKTHIEPGVGLLCDAITTGYLHPALGDPESRLVVTANATELVGRPNQAKDAKDLWDRGAVSNATLRAANGFADSDAPTDEELAERKEFLRSRRATTSSSDGLGPAGDPDTAHDGPGDSDPGSDVQAALINELAEFAITRAIERAGARFRSLAVSKDEQIKATLTTDVFRVAAELGRPRVAYLMKGDQFFPKDFDLLQQRVAELSTPQFAKQFIGAARQEAERRMFDPDSPKRPLPRWQK